MSQARDMQAIQNTIDLQCEMRRQLQCKALREPEKSPRRRNKASNGKNNAREQSKQSKIGARHRAAHVRSRKMKNAREVDLRAQGNETRISLSQSLAVRASAAKRFLTIRPALMSAAPRCRHPHCAAMASAIATVR